MFNKSFIPFEKISQISEKDLAYVNQDPKLRPFYKYDPMVSSFAEVIKDKKDDQIDRSLLRSVLKRQYQNFNLSKATKENIEALSEDKTFTIITAHQPSLFTGPSYFIYKISSILNLANQLNQKYPSNKIVPVFIMGGEDHDFEEISTTKIFGKTIIWSDNTGGSVGKIKNDSLEPVLSELKSMLGTGEFAEDIYQKIETAFTKFLTYGEGMRYLVNEIFGIYGLIVVDMSDKALKHAFVPFIKKEILEKQSHKLVKKTVSELEKVGIGNQAFPREINLFYLGNGFRDRIVFEDERYQVLNQNLSFTEAEIIQEIEENPDRFSPNVIMRPIYQEAIFPNLAYIGGGGELAYWIERKSQFEYFGLNFPLLIRRNSVLIVDEGSKKKLDKLSLSLQHLLMKDHETVNQFLEIHSKNTLSLEKNKNDMTTIFENIIESTKQIDGSLVPKVKAEMAKQLKVLDNLEGKLKKAEKNKFNTGINQISKLREKLFPGDSLQERKENFLTYYTKYGNSYLDYLVENLDPFSTGLMILEKDLH